MGDRMLQLPGLAETFFFFIRTWMGDPLGTRGAVGNIFYSYLITFSQQFVYICLEEITKRRGGHSCQWPYHAEYTHDVLAMFHSLFWCF